MHMSLSCPFILELISISHIITGVLSQAQLTDTERSISAGFIGRDNVNVRLLNPGHGSHIDLPGQHGNQSPHPVVHREAGSTLHGSSVNVDLPGQHGNNSPIPVVHRPGTGSHVDLPGQHGNHSPHPVVHRDGTGLNDHSSSQHGNNSPLPVAHRQTGTHVDQSQGQHGNQSPLPVIHRHTDTQIDQSLGLHGNHSPAPIFHRNDVHVDLPGHYNQLRPSWLGRMHGGYIDPVTGSLVNLSRPNVAPSFVPQTMPAFSPIGPHLAGSFGNMFGGPLPRPIGLRLPPFMLSPGERIMRRIRRRMRRRRRMRWEMIMMGDLVPPFIDPMRVHPGLLGGLDGFITGAIGI